MKSIVIALLCLMVAACNSCTPQPSPAPLPVPTVILDAAPPPVGDAAPGPTPDVDPGVRDACANIGKIGCAEAGPTCPGVMQKALVEHITLVPLDCLVGAHTKDDVHLCGSFVPCK